MQRFSKILSLCLVCILIAAQPLFPQIVIKAVGDVMPGSLTPRKILPPQNGKIIADSISRYLQGSDISIGNFEGTFVNDTMKSEKCPDSLMEEGKCYAFGVPLKLAPVIKGMKLSAVSLDNNHANDFGHEGYLLTKQTLTNLGIVYLQKKSYAVINVRDKKIAMVPFGFSGNSYKIFDLNKEYEIIKKLKAQHNIVVVYFHGGAEGGDANHVKDSTEYFLGENRGNELKFAHTAIDAGADLVLGSGPHVLRGLEIYKNKLIAYSLGNFFTYGNINVRGINGITAILEFKMNPSNGNFISGRIVPFEQTGFGIPVYDKDKKAIKNIRELSKSDFPNSKLLIGSEGNLLNPLNLAAIGIEKNEKNLSRKFKMKKKRIKLNISFSKTGR